MKYKIKIEQDECPENPRIEWDNLGTMVCWHSRYTLGDKHSFENPQEAREHFKATKAIYLPLYLYDHSGITISCSPFSCSWDSGQIGFIYIEREDLLRNFSKKRMSKSLIEKANKILQSEVTTYDQYLTGDIWNYTIEDNEGNSIDSCCGFYGREYAEQEAQSMVDWQIKEDIKEHCKQVKAWIKNKVPLIHRIALP